MTEVPVRALSCPLTSPMRLSAGPLFHPLIHLCLPSSSLTMCANQ